MATEEADGGSKRSTALTDSQVRELTAAFNTIDRNGDGQIQQNELRHLMRSLGDFSDRDIIEMMSKADIDGNGQIDLQEFLNVNAAATKTGSSVERLSVVFDSFDCDKDGFIQADELFKMMKQIGEKGITLKDCQEIIAAVDKNGDGMVDFEDFQIMMEGA